MIDKKQAATKNKPVHTIRCREVTASIFERQSNAGFVYWDYSLGRTWAGRSRESHGSTFFEKHETDLIQVIREVTEWLRVKTHTPPKEQTPDDQGTDLEPKDKAAPNGPLPRSR